MNSPNFLMDAMQDLRYALSKFRREPGFTVFALLIVGLGIGASVTVYSVTNAVLLRPLPFRDPGQLAWVANSGSEGMSGQTVQVGHFLDVRERNHSFSEMAAYFAFYGVGDSKLTGSGEPERLSGVPVSQNFFPLLGVQPLFGRFFEAEECKFNGPRVVVLSHAFWQRRFAADPAILGRKLILDDVPVQVVGVLPPSFDFGTVFAPGTRIDLFFPFPLTPETNRWGNTLAIVGRLKPGVAPATAEAELRAIGERLGKEHPERNPLRPRVIALEEHVGGRLRPALQVLVFAVAMVMLIVCANLSNLQLARTAARQKEMAIRTALGARRARLIRQTLTESVLLSSCGALLGWFLAYAAVRVLSHLDAISIPLLDTAHLDASALAVTMLLAIGTGVLFGLIPAIHASYSIHETLKDGTRGSSTGKGHTWIRSGLVVSEITVAFVLLVGAGLLVRSFLKLLDVNMGFHPEHAGALRIDPSRQLDANQRNAYFDEALRRVREIPGVQAAGLTDVLPYGRNRTWGFRIKGAESSRDVRIFFVRIVSEGYLRAMGIPLVRGRDFSPTDRQGAEPVILINETLAKQLPPGQDPIGQVLEIAGGRRVVGVVGDVRHLALEKGSGAEVYISMRQIRDYSSVDVVVRSTLPPDQMAPAIRAALRPLDPNLPGNDFRTLQQLVDKSVSPRRVVIWLLGGFAAFALILASLGIYAVISYSVTQRRQEIGIRMALGASAEHVQRRVLLQTLSLALAGIALGLAASWVGARLLTGMLYGITPADPLTFGGMVSLLAAVAGLAGYLPARRAATVDPILALRAE